MQVILTEDLIRHGLTDEQRLFVEALYQMVHLESMDSHRAKCLNLRTIVCELRHELQTGRLEEDELKAFCKECLEFLQSDPLGEPVFPHHYAGLLPFLKSPTPKPKKVDKPDECRSSEPSRRSPMPLRTSPWSLSGATWTECARSCRRLWRRRMHRGSSG